MYLTIKYPSIAYVLCPYIEKIYLGHNQIHLINKILFSKAMNMTELSLDHNFISTIHIYGFAKAKGIQKLDLHGKKTREHYCRNYDLVHRYYLDISLNTISDITCTC